MNYLKVQQQLPLRLPAKGMALRAAWPLGLATLLFALWAAGFGF